MFYTYIIQSEKTSRYYIGYTKDMTVRLERHNSGWSKSTRSGIPWKLVYFEKYESKSDAIKRERKLKSYKNKQYLERLIINSVCE
ncbi:MAG: GIY-YIG nuclease family protein [Candidatus Marinimicrobia bacterium]|nr:GIY-YIG nuclease family protein [Candidatus Neomarinimicrobiota bacterium]